MVRLTDRPDMTLDVYHGRKTAIQQQLNHYPWYDGYLLNSAQDMSKSLSHEM